MAPDPPSELERFCEQQYEPLVKALTLLLRNRDAAEDVAQLTLVRVIEHWHEIQEMDHPIAWTYRVAFNAASSRARRLSAAGRALSRLASRRSPQEGAILDHDAAMAVRAALQRLPRRQREAVLLRYYVGLPVVEVANAMTCSPETVKSHLHSALGTLRGSALLDFEEEQER